MGIIQVFHREAVSERSIIMFFIIWLLLAPLFCMGTQEINASESGVIQCGPQTITLQRRFLEQVGIAWLTWQDDPSCSTLQDQLVYEVQVLRAGNPVHHDSVVVPTEQIGSTHSWAWTSSLPLECVSHSFRLRSLYQNHTSPWSKAETIPGVTSRKEPKVFPKDRLVEVGTNLTFCCILDAGERLERMQVQGYDDDSLKTTKISNQTYALTVHLNAPSGTSCTDVTCNTRKYGACVYVGYPPADQDLQCETRDLQLVECRWNSGRDTHLIKKTVYRLQESLYSSPCECSCESGAFKNCSCKHMARVIVGERNWTLTATNKLGRSVLTDRADLTKRVRMFAPENVMASSVNARSASLKWQWTAGKYKLLDLLCQLQLSHGELTDRVNSSGVGLGFTVLLGLIPSQTYTVQVRCGAKEHFWTWGDWSTSHTFKTKDDIPDALDVWMLQEQNQPVTITWKTLLANQSHGQILDYEVTWGKTGENERRTVTIYPPENSVALRLDAGEEHVVAVTARNLNGSSSPSAVIIPRFDPDKESVKPSKISGTDGGFHVSWSADPEAICGYVVAWYPTFSKCKVEWLKVPAGVTNARILSETFRPGVRYSLFIHACTSGAPKLLERRDGYVRETKLQDKQIKGLKWKQMGSDVQVSWRAISPRNQTAFIQGYIMYYNDSIHQKTLRTDDPDATNLTARNLHASTYTLKLKALTSIGECGDTSFSLTIDSPTDGLITVIVSLVGVFSLISFASLVTVLCYRHWGCVKHKFYPPIPKPVLTDDWGRCGHRLLTDPRHHSQEEIVAVPELYRQVAPANDHFSQEYGPLVASQTQTPKGYCNQPLTNSIPTPETISSPPGTAGGDVLFRRIFENPVYNMGMQPEENNIWPSVDLAYQPCPDHQHVRNSSSYQPQDPMETITPPQTKDEPERPLLCDLTYIMIPQPSSK